MSYESEWNIFLAYITPLPRVSQEENRSLGEDFLESVRHLVFCVSQKMQRISSMGAATVQGISERYLGKVIDAVKHSRMLGRSVIR